MRGSTITRARAFRAALGTLALAGCGTDQPTAPPTAATCITGLTAGNLL